MMGILSNFRPELKSTEAPPSKESKPSEVTHAQPATLDTLDALDPPPSSTKTPERIIEATFRDATKMGRRLPSVDYAEPHAVSPVSPEFPPCPRCGSTRYWISRGKVLCGSRTCYSAVRFILTKIEYHQVH